MKKEETKIVSKGTDGYGYKYASLGDIAKQGFVIPKMRTGSEDGREYIYYQDGDEWFRGAEIVIPESKGMNKAQLYGSALTYARRYTALLALSLACDLDENIESIDENGEIKAEPKSGKKYNGEPKKASESQINFIKSLYSEHEKLLQWANVQKFEDLTVAQASELIARKQKREEANDNQI